jgi:hypothetical protein
VFTHLGLPPHPWNWADSRRPEQTGDFPARANHGTSSWTIDRRKQFADSLGDGQLLAVTDNVNSSKSDKDAAEWQPPLASYRCTFAEQVVHVKYGWGLSMDAAEKAAINDMLATC